MQQADDRIIIMPGSGLNSSNVTSIIQTAGVQEVHTSARILVPSQTLYRNERMPENFDLDFVNAEEIQKIKSLITNPANVK